MQTHDATTDVLKSFEYVPLWQQAESMQHLHDQSCLAIDLHRLSKQREIVDLAANLLAEVKVAAMNLAVWPDSTCCIARSFIIVAHG